MRLNPVEWVDPYGLSTVYLRNNEVYVGKAKVNAVSRYGRRISLQIFLKTYRIQIQLKVLSKLFMTD